MRDDQLSKLNIRSKIAQGMNSVRAGKTIPAEQVKSEMAAFKAKIFESKLKTRKQLAQLPFEEKIALLKKIRVGRSWFAASSPYRTKKPTN